MKLFLKLEERGQNPHILNVICEENGGFSLFTLNEMHVPPVCMLILLLTRGYGTAGFLEFLKFNLSVIILCGTAVFSQKSHLCSQTIKERVFRYVLKIASQNLYELFYVINDTVMGKRN